MKKIKVYMCAVDYQHELGEVNDYTPVYSTVEDLKRQRKCWSECGIVAVEISLVEWIKPQNFLKKKK